MIPITLFSAPSTPRQNDEESAAFVLLAGDNSIALANAAAEMWLAELRGSGPGDRCRP